MRRRHAALMLLALLPGAPLSAAAPAASAPGTTIVGEREAAVGLYLTPWREEAASDVDRPPRLFEPPRQTLEAAEFEREVELRESIEAYHRARLLRR